LDHFLPFRSAAMLNFLHSKELEGRLHTPLPHTLYKLNPARATWTIGDLHDTIYSDEDNVVDGWNKFYLPEIVNMQVLGVVKGTSCPCDQLVLMTCEDTMVYGYDGEELHLVASSINQLSDKGLKYPAAESYDKGKPFQKMQGFVIGHLTKVQILGESQIHQTQHRLVFLSLLQGKD
uniref:Uncharacterized protein n=1 Tax=Cyclopterus lumpus TaxID=8103 RepID=A0A8C3ALZ1_CYCLU